MGKRVVVCGAPDEVSAFAMKSEGPFLFARGLAARDGMLAVASGTNVAMFNADGLVHWVKKTRPMRLVGEMIGAQLL